MPFRYFWEKYFIYQTIKAFCLFLFGFYSLYILIDYSSHAGTFHQNHVKFQFGQVTLYYAGEFIRRAEVLVPFSLLIATVKTLSGLNQNNELVALMTCGVSLRRLLRPFLFLGMFFTLALYANTEYFLPNAMKTLKKIDDNRKGTLLKNRSEIPVQHLVLEDKSTLIFQEYDTTRQLFIGAYWIRSIDDIYRIKHLYPYDIPPKGHFVDHLVRNQNRELLEKESFPVKTFGEMQFNKQKLLDTITTPDQLALTQLWKKQPSQQEELSEKEAQAISALYYKLALPWLALLAVMGVAPWCVKFSRNLPLFLIYACSIFGLISCYLLLDAALVLGERQVLHPAYAIGIPFGVIFFSVVGKYSTLR